MPFTLDKKYDPLYKEGWNEAWNEAWSEAKLNTKIEDAIIMIKEFNLPIESVANKFGIDKNILIERLKDNIENRD